MFCSRKPIQLSVHSFVRGNTCIQMPSCGLARSSQFQMDKNTAVGVCTVCVQRILEKVTKGKSCRKSQTANMFCSLKPIQLSVHSFVRGNTCIQIPSCGLARSSQFQMYKNTTVGACTICVFRILEKVTKGKCCRKSYTSNLFCSLKPIQLSVHSFVRGNTCIQMPSCGLSRSRQFQMDKNTTVGVCTICVQHILEKVTKGKSCRKSQTANMFCSRKPIQLSVHSFVRGNTCIQMPSCGLARSSQFQMDKNTTVGVCTICVQRILEKVTKGKSCRKSWTSNMFCSLTPIQLSVHSFVRGNTCIQVPSCGLSRSSCFKWTRTQQQVYAQFAFSLFQRR